MICPRHYNVIDFHWEGPVLRVSISSGLERSDITSDTLSKHIRLKLFFSNNLRSD
jgi:hypothetical protein